jgi:hypothetical protein
MKAQNIMIGICGEEVCLLQGVWEAKIEEKRRSQCPNLPFKGTPLMT